MAEHQTIPAICLLVVSLLFLNSNFVAGKTYFVGDETGWNLSFYEKRWLVGKHFKSGDTLVFKYNPMEHNVAKVDRLAYDTCGEQSNEAEIFVTGNDYIKLAKGGNYFFSSVDQPDCFMGIMKLAITAE